MVACRQAGHEFGTNTELAWSHVVSPERLCELLCLTVNGWKESVSSFFLAYY